MKRNILGLLILFLISVYSLTAAEQFIYTRISTREGLASTVTAYIRKRTAMCGWERLRDFILSTDTGSNIMKIPCSVTVSYIRSRRTKTEVSGFLPTIG